MKRVYRNLPITYGDWLRVALRFAGKEGVIKVDAFVYTQFLRTDEEVSYPESKLFDIIWGEK